LLGVIGFCAYKLRPIYEDVRQLRSAAPSTSDPATVPTATQSAATDGDTGNAADAEPAAENSTPAESNAKPKDPSTPVVEIKSSAIEKSSSKRPESGLTARAAEYKGRIEGLKVAIIGDILHSRVARSNIYLLTKLGASVSVGGPGTLAPDEFAGIVENGLTVERRFEDAIEGADVVMILRIQRERQDAAFFPSMREYAVHYGLQPRHLERAAPDAIVMHPGPMNRGVELSSEIADGSRSLILDQVTNGVAVRMAVLYLLANKNTTSATDNTDEITDRKRVRDRSGARNQRRQKSSA